MKKALLFGASLFFVLGVTACNQPAASSDETQHEHSHEHDGDSHSHDHEHDGDTSDHDH